MATVQELNEKLDALEIASQSERQEVLDFLKVLKDEIQALKDQVGSGGVATQADLDALSVRLDEQIVITQGTITEGDK